VRRRQEKSRKWWPWALLLLLLFGGIYWLIRPEPGRPQFASEMADLGDVRFGAQGEPFEIVMTNGGELPLETSTISVAGEHAGDFLVLDDGCSVTNLVSGDSCRVELRFTPTGVGERLAALQFVGRDTVPLPLRGRSTAPRLDRQPETVDFSEVPVGERAAGADLTIVNGGTARLEVKKVYVEGRHAPEFRLTGRCDEEELAPGDGCGFRIAFEPRAAGARTAELVLETDTPTGVERVPLVGQGVWDGPELVVEPGRVDAGLARVGSTSKGKRLKFINRAAETVAVADVEISAPGFAVSSDSCSGETLEPGTSCTVDVSFRPKAVGDQGATLDLRLRDGGGASVPLAGRGGNANLELSIAALDLGQARIEAEEQTGTIEIVSSGEIGLATESLKIVGRAASSFRVQSEDCTAKTVSPGGRCTVTVSFRPVSAGQAEAELVVASDASSGAATVALKGEGLGGKLAPEPGRLVFSPTHRGESEEMTVELKNRGSAPFSVAAVKIAGAAQAEYLLVDDRCGGGAVSPGSQCTVDIRFLPGREGKRLAFLVVDHDAIEGPGEIALSGEGLPPVPTIRVDPATMDFGSLDPGEIGAIQTVTIRNPGLGPLQIRDISIVGPASGEFRRVPGTCSGVPKLAPRSECSFGLRYTPSAAGQHEAEVSIDHDAPQKQSRIRLVGSARAPATPPSPTTAP